MLLYVIALQISMHLLCNGRKYESCPTRPNPVSKGPSRGAPGLGCVAFEKLKIGVVLLKNPLGRPLETGFESAPGRPKPFRAKVEYSNQLKSYEKSKASFSSFFLPPRGLECVGFEKRTKGALRSEKCRKVARRL